MTSLKFCGIFCVIGDILRRLWFCFGLPYRMRSFWVCDIEAEEALSAWEISLAWSRAVALRGGKRFVLLRIFHPFFVFALAFLWMAAIAAEEGKFFLHQSNSPKKRIERIGFAVVGRQLFSV